MLEKTPPMSDESTPHNLEAERAVLGACRVVRAAPALVEVAGLDQGVVGLLPARRRDVEALASLQVAPRGEHMHVYVAVGRARGCAAWSTRPSTTSSPTVSPTTPWHPTPRGNRRSRGGRPASSTRAGAPCSKASGWSTSPRATSCDQGRQAGHALDAAVVPSVPGERSAPATERLGLQPGQPLAQTGPAATDQALVAHESPAAAGEDRGPAREARPVLLAPPGRRASDQAAVRRHAAEDLGTTRAGRLTRGLSATKPAWRRSGTPIAVVAGAIWARESFTITGLIDRLSDWLNAPSEGRRRSRRQDAATPHAVGTPVRRTQSRGLGGSRVYKGAIRGRQNGNLGFFNSVS